jgi:hypothetical protein
MVENGHRFTLPSPSLTPRCCRYGNATVTIEPDTFTEAIQDECRLYTVLHVLLGSCVLSVGLALYTDSLLLARYVASFCVGIASVAGYMLGTYCNGHDGGVGVRVRVRVHVRVTLLL